MTCTNCRGTGEIVTHEDKTSTCPHCDGNGFVAEEGEDCHGSGEGLASGTTCRTCRGRGEL